MTETNKTIDLPKFQPATVGDLKDVIAADISLSNEEVEAITEKLNSETEGTVNQNDIINACIKAKNAKVDVKLKQVEKAVGSRSAEKYFYDIKEKYDLTREQIESEATTADMALYQKGELDLPGLVEKTIQKNQGLKNYIDKVKKAGDDETAEVLSDEDPGGVSVETKGSKDQVNDWMI